MEKGKLIFSSRCASCHHMTKDLTGPALSGIDERRPMNWIVNFIHSPREVINSEDEYAVALYNKFNKIVMPDHADLSEADIKDVIEYIKTESNQATENKAPFPKPAKLRPTYEPLSITHDYAFFISYIIFVCVLIGAMLLAVEVKSLQRK